MYRLRLFGGASLVGPTGPVSGRAAQRRPLALLALLAAAGESGLSRAKIVGHLWPETRERRARHLLSVALHALRKALGSEAIVSAGDDLVLDPALVEVDVRAFGRALEAGEPERAVELYEGAFLDGFHVDDAPDFERWLDRRREAYARAYRSALEELAEEAEAAGDWARAADRWRELAAEAPFSSRVTLRLMGALERAGDRPNAVRAARVHAARVQADLGLEPDPDVADLAARLADGEVERTEDVAARLAEHGPADAVPAAVETARERPARALPATGAGPDADSDGTERSSGDAPAFRATTTRAVVAAILLVGLGTLATAAVLSDETPTPDPKRVLVDVFENGTGDPDLDELGRMAADWITQGLTYTGFVDVVTRGTPLLAGQSAPGPDSADLARPLVEVARAHGTGTLVWGSFHQRGDSVVFRAHVTDAGDRRELASLEPVAASIEAPVAGLERLRDRVMAALATLTDPRLERWQRHASKPPTFEAYRTFVEGLELHTTQRRPADAAEKFRVAAALDPGFTMARLWEVLVTPDRERALAILRDLEGSRERLPSLDRAFLDYLVASKRDQDPDEMLRAGHRMAEIAPGSEYLKLTADAALWAGRPAEAIPYYERADPESGWLRGWAPYWSRYAEALHALGRYERELEVVRRGEALHPDEGRIRERQIRALAALGRADELEDAVEEYVDLLGARRRGYALRLAGEDLTAHGHEAAGRKFYRRAVEWYRERLAEGGEDAYRNRISVVGVLRRLGELEEADAELAVLLAEHPKDPWVLAEAALLRAQQGRPEAAYGFAHRYEEVGGPANNLPEPNVAALLGERERAMRLLREMEETQGVHRPWLRHTPHLDSLRGHPSFEELFGPKG